MNPDEEENDLKALGLGRKLIRQEGGERFDTDWLKIVINSPKVAKYRQNDNGYTFWLSDGNIIDLYPKANKLLIRKTHKWVKPALKWIINQILSKP